MRPEARTGAIAAVTSARPSTSTTTGTATTFAGTVTSEIWWNWSHVTGAVARPHAVETPISCASPCETGYPSSARTTRGVTTKIAATAAKESWKPGVEQRVRVPREEDGRADEQRLPAVALPRREPRERAERRNDSGTHDGRVETDRERVGRDGGERGNFGRDPAQAREQCYPRRPRSAIVDDLQAVDREAVVEARRAEVGEQRLARRGSPGRGRSPR